MESLHGRGGSVAAPVEPLSLGDILEVIDIPDAMKRVLCHLYVGSVQSLLDDVATGAIRNIAGLGRKQKHALLIGTDRVLDALYVVVREGGCRVCGSKSLLDSTDHFLPKGMVLPVNLPDDMPRPSMMQQPASRPCTPSTSEGWAAAKHEQEGSEGDPPSLRAQVVAATVVPHPTKKERSTSTTSSGASTDDREAESWIQLDEDLFVPCMWQGVPMCVPWREALSAGLVEAPAPPSSAASAAAAAPLNEHVQLFQASRPLTRAAPPAAAGEIPEGAGSLAAAKPSVHVGHKRGQRFEVATATGNHHLPGKSSSSKVLVRNNAKGGPGPTTTHHRSHGPNKKKPKSRKNYPSSANKRTTTTTKTKNRKSKPGARRPLVRPSSAKVRGRASPGSSKRLLQRTPQKRVGVVVAQENDTNTSACTSPAVNKFVQKASGMLKHREPHAAPLQTNHRSAVHPNQLECRQPLTREPCHKAAPRRSLVINTASKARNNAGSGPGLDSGSDNSGASDSEDSFASPVRRDGEVPSCGSSDNNSSSSSSSGKRGERAGDETALSPLSAARERYRRMQDPPHCDESSSTSSTSTIENRFRKPAPPTMGAESQGPGGRTRASSALAAAFDDVPQPDVLPTMHGLPMLNARLEDTLSTQCYI